MQLGYGYAMYERYQHVDIDRSTLTLETGYLASDRLNVRAFAIGQKTHGGLDFPDDYSPQANPGLYYHHDQTQRVDFIDVGFGASYTVSEKYSLFSSVFKTAWGENGHETDYSISVGVSRQF